MEALPLLGLTHDFERSAWPNMIDVPPKLPMVLPRHAGLELPLQVILELPQRASHKSDVSTVHPNRLGSQHDRQPRAQRELQDRLRRFYTSLPERPLALHVRLQILRQRPVMFPGEDVRQSFRRLRQHTYNSDHIKLDSNAHARNALRKLMKSSFCLSKISVQITDVPQTNRATFGHLHQWECSFRSFLRNG